MRKLLLSYIKFWWKSKNQHAIHSPFVYNLVTNCFYDTSNYSSYKHLKQYRKTLSKNKDTIVLTYLGVGLHILKNNLRKISHIASNAGTTPKRAKLLFRLCQYFKFNLILELRTSIGIATQAMSLGNPKAKITTIEGCPNISEFSKDNFKQLRLGNIEILIGNFSDYIETIKHNTYDLIFFDGNHQKEATLHYFETLLQTTHNDSVFIFDDIYWSKEMTEAWETILQHPKVTVSIDTFFWGFVFFRKEQNKEHFVIRI